MKMDNFDIFNTLCHILLRDPFIISLITIGYYIMRTYINVYVRRKRSIILLYNTKFNYNNNL